MFGSTVLPISNAQKHLDATRKDRMKYREGTSDFEFYNVRVQALKVVIDYFKTIQGQLDSLGNTRTKKRYENIVNDSPKAWYEDRQFDS